MKAYAIAAACLLAFTAAPAASQKVEQVRFARGASGTTITGAIVGRDYLDYQLRLAAGQKLSVALQRTGGSPYFNIIEPGAGDVAIHNSAVSSQTFEGRTRLAGIHTIRVYQMRASGRRGERASYRLLISATNPAPTAATAAAPTTAPTAHSTDALVPGTPYHATAMIRCVAEPAKPMSSCRAGVIRRGASATIHIDTPDGGARTILFRNNKPVSSDSEAGLITQRRGDTMIVKIGTSEVYEIPDAFVQGG